MRDLELRQNVLDELVFEPRVNAAHIGVAAENGVVTLSGHVGSYLEKLAAEKAARRVRGVKALAEEIKVRLPSDKKTADDEIASRALTILHWNGLLPANAINVKVQDGWVALSGKARWHYERVAAESAIRRLSGVAGVVNTIAITTQAQAPDIKRRIEDALKRNAEVDVRDIQVSIKDGGTVCLEGRVHDWRDREVIEEAAWAAPGVVDVDDRLAIV